MDRILVLRARGGAGYKRKGRPFGDEEMPRRESMSRVWGSKRLAENLAPLRRFLMSRAGMRWDDVYSEICARIQGRNTVQQHVLVHLEALVEQHPFFVNGVPHRRCFSRNGAYLEPLYRSRWRCLHVEPMGRLAVNPLRPRRERRSRRRR